MTQPFALFAKNLFEEQTYPDLSKYPHAWQGLVRTQKFKDAYIPPYDMAGWTLPYQMGVKRAAANTPLEANLTKLDKVEAPAGKIEGSGSSYLLSPKTNNSFIAVNRILKEGGTVSRAKDSFSVSGKSHLPGTYIVRSGVSRSFMDSLAKDLDLTVVSAGGPSVDTFGLKAPRVALYQSWTASMDEGWTRWLFEQYEFPFTNIHDADIKAGELRTRFDVLVIPSMSTDGIVDGHRKGTMPPQYVGGITENGVRNIKTFVEEGGTLVTLNSGCLFAIDKLELPVSDVLKGLRPPGRRDPQPKDPGPPQFACPGSLLRMEFDVKHPVTYGMPEEAPALFSRSPAFKIMASFEDDKAPVAIAKYPKGDLLVSGYLLGEKHLKNKASVVEVPLGDGQVILLGFGVQSRAQPHGTFKLLFNSLYYSSSQ